MFFAFTGKEIEQPEKIFEIQDGYECWNLKKLNLDEFSEEIKKKIPPVNQNVLPNYIVEDKSIGGIFGINKKLYEKSSWGLLVPDTLEEGGFAHTETMFLFNLYSPNFLYPLFSVNDMGIMKQDSKKDPLIYFHTQDHSIFKTKEFVTFYKTLFEQSKYGSWYLDRIQKWEEEDWRLFVAAFLYTGLKDYENEKSSFGWQRESAEMATILESLFTAEKAKNEEIGYRLRKRIATLLSYRFPSIEEDIKELYTQRSAFVHGSFFAQIAKDSKTANNNLPIPDFGLLYKQKEYVRWALVAYLYLAQLVRLQSAMFGDIKTVINLLEQSIIDIELRKKVLEETEKILSLMPKSKAFDKV